MRASTIFALVGSALCVSTAALPTPQDDNALGNIVGSTLGSVTDTLNGAGNGNGDGAGSGNGNGSGSGNSAGNGNSAGDGNSAGNDNGNGNSAGNGSGNGNNLGNINSFTLDLGEKFGGFPTRMDICWTFSGKKTGPGMPGDHLGLNVERLSMDNRPTKMHSCQEVLKQVYQHDNEALAFAET